MLALTLTILVVLVGSWDASAYKEVSWDEFQPIASRRQMPVWDDDIQPTWEKPQLAPSHNQAPWGDPEPLPHTRRHRQHRHALPYDHHHGEIVDNPLVPLPECPTGCVLKVLNIHEVRSTFQDLLDESDTSVVFFKLHFPGQNISVMDQPDYKDHNFRASEWVWASEKVGLKLLGLPLDADVLSLYILDAQKKQIDLYLSTIPEDCLLLQSPSCRLLSVRKLLILNVTYTERHKHKRNFVCTRAVQTRSNRSGPTSALYEFVYHCCDTAEFHSGDHKCRNYTTHKQEISGLLVVINIIALLFTLFSPIIIMKIKMVLKYDNVTKFFRASLKHGITGQRNYVIRISSRQLINLSDPKPFSVPRFLFRTIFHCYGEGRCCIHWWGEWSHQPTACQKDSPCQKCWYCFFRISAVTILYPFIIYLGIILYAPKLALYASIIEFANTLDKPGAVDLHVNLLGWSLLPMYSPLLSVWLLFSFAAFVYTVLLLSWPNNPLERCLLQIPPDTKRSYEQPAMLYAHMTRNYKKVAHKLAYGDYPTKRHFFRIKWIPWGVRRTLKFILRLLMQIPVINLCFSLSVFDAKVFKIKKDQTDSSNPSDPDETKRKVELTRPTCQTVCKVICSLFIWSGFVFVLAGYCTMVFVMTEFLLNMVFFTFLGAILNASTVLPWILFTAVVIFYINDTLAMINREHRDILKLIDENSPRISAVEDTEDVFRDRNIQILRTHNLGAVKFIDGDNTEYVSKELYYNVCTDLKCGWTRSMRRILCRMTCVVLFVLFLFLSSTVLGSLTGSRILVTLTALLASLIPKIMEMYRDSRPEKRNAKRSLWAKIMPDILDRHIRVDRTQCLDQAEEDLSTYDVRPVGSLDMDIPRMQASRSLHLWKFPWIVSADQQTQSHESFIIALANKLAAAAFLSKLVTRAYSPELEDEVVLRQWCLLVENCILEGSATASSINGAPVDSIRLFPRDVQPLVSPFNTGSTVDAVVDAINRELYGPYTRGVLVTIGNTTLAMCKMDNTIFAFNSSCHGDQVTDLFGAVLIATEFNTQNLQTTIKFIVDPYAPDAVPVYSIVPIEGFVFRSAEIMQYDLPIEL